MYHSVHSPPPDREREREREEEEEEGGEKEEGRIHSEYCYNWRNPFSSLLLFLLPKSVNWAKHPEESIKPECCPNACLQTFIPIDGLHKKVLFKTLARLQFVIAHSAAVAATSIVMLLLAFSQFPTPNANIPHNTNTNSLLDWLMVCLIDRSIWPDYERCPVVVVQIDFW